MGKPAIDELPTLDVSAIVISFNSEDRIGEAIVSHQAALAHLEAEILVVDNASQDGSVAEAERTLTRGRVIANDTNLGYGHAANQGIAAARGRACLILNDDARIQADSVDALLEALDSDSRIALVGPRIVDEDGNPMPSARTVFPGLAEEWQRLGDIVERTNTNRRYPFPADAPPFPVAWLVGACLLGDTTVLRRIGGFNPAFFLYSEDIDLCKRLNALGYEVVSVPEAVCIHTGSVSTGAVLSSTSRVRRRAESRHLFYRIWYRRPTRTLVHLRRAIGIRNQPWRFRYHLSKAIYDGPSLTHLRYPPPIG